MTDPIHAAGVAAGRDAIAGGYGLADIVYPSILVELSLEQGLDLTTPDETKRFAAGIRAAYVHAEAAATEVQVGRPRRCGIHGGTALASGTAATPTASAGGCRPPPGSTAPCTCGSTPTSTSRSSSDTHPHHTPRTSPCPSPTLA